MAKDIVYNIKVKGKKDVDKVTSSTKKLGKEVGLLKGGLTKMLVVWTGFLAGITAVSAALKGAFNIVKDFQQANANLASVLGKTRSEIQELSKDAIRLGSSTKFTATEVSNLQKEFAKLGFTQREILNVTEATLSLAAATGTDLAEAARVAGATIRGFGLDASETQRIVDVMTQSFSSSALDMNKFATAMSKVAPIAKAVGLTIEETTAFMGTLSDAGIDASIIGTSLRRIFSELSKKGLTLNEALDKITNSQEKLNTANQIFGTIGATSALVLAENADKAELLTKKLNESAGAADKMAKEQLNTLEGKLTTLTSAWEGLILSLDDGTGTFSDLTSGIVVATTNILNFLSGTKDLDKEVINLTDDLKKLSDQQIKDIIKIGKINEERNKFLKQGILLTEKEEQILIEKVDADIKSADAKRKAEEEALKAAEKEEKRLLALPKLTEENKVKLLKIQQELLDSQNRLIDDDEKRKIAQIEAFFDKRIVKLDKNNKKENELLIQFEKEKQQKINDVVKEFSGKRDDIEKENDRKLLDFKRRIEDIKLDILEEGFDKKREQLQLDFDRELVDFEGNEDQKRELAILLKKKLIAALAEIDDEEEEKGKEKEVKKKEDEELEFDEKLEKISEAIDIAQDFADEISQIQSNLAQVTQNRFDEAISGLKDQFKEEKKTLTSSAKFQKKTDQEKELAIAELEIKQIERENVLIEARNKQRKKEFENEKKIATAQALINGAASVVKAMAKFGPPPSPLGIAAIITAGVITATQIAAIRSTSFKGGTSALPIPDLPTFDEIDEDLDKDAESGGINQDQLFGVGTEFTTTTETFGGGPGINQQGAPIRAFVVESDITQTQNTISDIESRAEIG